LRTQEDIRCYLGICSHGLACSNWPADAGPIPDQSAVNKAQKLLGAFDERSRRPDLAIIMYCRPEGASNVEVRSATGDTWTQKAKKLHLQRKLDFMKAKMPDGALRYFIGLPDSRPGPPNAVEFVPRHGAKPTPVDGIRDDLERFMRMYPERRSRAFATDEELWECITSLQNRLSALPAVAARPDLGVDWSVGQGNWARVPWIAFLDARITDTTERGIYGVFLFREDMSGVYLTFNQGVTEPKETHGATSGLQLLRETATALRSQCGELERVGFRLDDGIDLRTEGTLGRDYEAATIAYKLYERDNLPDNEEIAADIEALLATYDRYIGAQISEQPPNRPIPPPALYTMQEALADLFLNQEDLEQLLILLRTKKNLVLQGPPGVGKTFIARRLAYLLMEHRDDARFRMVQFHQAYAYEDFIQGYRPSESGGFIRRDGLFFDFAKLAEAEPHKPYVFVIDEINRGNLSKILGELMLLIESDKRGEEYALPLAYSRPDERPFSVPPNLYILGLMNTADRSLAIVDYALRRRFAFQKLQPQFSNSKFRAYLETRGTDHDLINLIIDRMTALNDEIAADKLRLGWATR